MVAFTAGAVLTAANLNTAFNALTFRAVTGTSDTFVLADNGGAVSYSNASPITATVPPFSSVAYANGTVIQLLNLGAGVVTVTAGVGVTLNGANLTLAQNAGGTLIKTATNTWYFLPSASASGMDLITPTSVAGSGVTLSGGKISFSAATSISANGVFTSAYDNYLILHDLTGASGTDPELRARLRLAGTDATTNYATVRIYSGGTAVSAQLPPTSGFFVGASDSGYAAFAGGEFTLMRPALAALTIMNAEYNQVISGGTHFLNRMSGYHNAATAYDGLTLVPSTGNVTGTMRIYGLRN